MSGYLIQIVYLLATLLLIIGLKKFSVAKTAQSGLYFSAIGVIISVLATYFHPSIPSNYLLITLAIIVGAIAAYFISKRSSAPNLAYMTNLFNGFGGLATAILALTNLLAAQPSALTTKYLSILAGFLACVGLAGNFLSFIRLKGWLNKPLHLPMHQWVNAFVCVIALTFGIAIVLNGEQLQTAWLVIFTLLSLCVGLLLIAPIELNKLAITQPLLNGVTGLAVSLIGITLAMPLLTAIGAIAGVLGITISAYHAKNQNSSIICTLFATDNSSSQAINTRAKNNAGVTELSISDASTMLALAKNIIIVPGFGMAKAQAQYKLWDLCKELQANGSKVSFAIHPAAGRMPGHMNVLLAETGIPYSLIHDLDDTNNSFETTDVVLMVGANDVTNPSARDDQRSPLYGMPILNADKAKNVIVIKRGEGKGFSQVDNPLFYRKNTGLVYGDAENVLNALSRQISTL